MFFSIVVVEVVYRIKCSATDFTLKRSGYLRRHSDIISIQDPIYTFE